MRKPPPVPMSAEAHALVEQLVTICNRLKDEIGCDRIAVLAGWSEDPGFHVYDAGDFEDPALIFGNLAAGHAARQQGERDVEGMTKQ